MKTGSCPRLFELEALHDGRLKGAELDRLNSHVQRCRVCSDEQRFLDEVHRQLRAPFAHDELQLRRLRYNVLSRAGSALSVERTSRRRWRTVAAAAVLLSVGAWGMAERYRAFPPFAGVKVEASSIGAQWARSSAAGTERFDLLDGSLALDCRGKSPSTHIVVRVPDGDVEDIGTVFKITVRQNHTQEIVVADGTVVFHRPLVPDVRITAGNRWIAPGETPKISGVAPAAPEPSPDPEKRAAHMSSRKDRPEPTRGSQRVPVLSPTECPDEDATYLQIVALLREGRIEEARMSAGSYLRRCPDGFRRAEVERISRLP